MRIRSRTLARPGVAAAELAIWLPFLLVGAIVGLVLLRWLFRIFVRNLPRIWALASTPITPPRAPTAGQ